MRAMLKIAGRECRMLLQTKSFLILAVIVPVAYALIIGSVYRNKKLTEIPVTIVDMDRSFLSREITRGIFASETFAPGQYADSADAFQRLAVEGKSTACFVFPSNFERDVKSGKGSRVAVWVDASNILPGNIAAMAASTIVGTYSAGVDVRKSLLRGRASVTNAASVVQPVRDEWHMLFNPALNSNYADFMLLGIVTTAIQLLTVLIAARSCSREYEERTVGEIGALGGGPVSIMLGKAVVYIAIMFPVSMLALYLPVWLMGIPMVGSGKLLAGVTLWFISMWVLVAMGVSAFVKDSMLTLELFTGFVMPSYLLTGYTWPRFAMPAGMQVVSAALPLSQYVTIVRRITMMGATCDCFIPEVRWLGIWSVIGVLLALTGSWQMSRAARAYIAGGEH